MSQKYIDFKMPKIPLIATPSFELKSIKIC